MCLKTTEEEGEATDGIVAAYEISVDAAVAAVLPELGGIFDIREEQIMVLKACLGGKHVFVSLSTGFGGSLAKHSGASRKAAGW